MKWRPKKSGFGLDLKTATAGSALLVLVAASWIVRALTGKEPLVDAKTAAAFALLILVAAYWMMRILARKDSGLDAHRVSVHVRIDDEVIDKADAWTIVEPVWLSVEIPNGEADYEKTLARFSREQRLLLAVFWYIAEVENGGHDLFYYNSTGIFWKDALAAFREMGVEESAAILEESAQRLGGNPSLDRATRYEQLESFNSVFDDLDQRYYEVDKRINLYGIMREYVRKHRAAFYFEGDVKKPKVLVDKARETL